MPKIRTEGGHRFIRAKIKVFLLFPPQTRRNSKGRLDQPSQMGWLYLHGGLQVIISYRDSKKNSCVYGFHSYVKCTSSSLMPESRQCQRLSTSMFASALGKGFTPPCPSPSDRQHLFLTHGREGQNAGLAGFKICFNFEFLGQLAQ